MSPETGQESKLEIKESIPQGNSVPNGVVTNGYFNHNSTSLINRQDNLILLPEPPKIPNPPHHDTDITEASLNKDDNVVSLFLLIRLVTNRKKCNTYNTIERSLLFMATCTHIFK